MHTGAHTHAHRHKRVLYTPSRNTHTQTRNARPMNATRRIYFLWFLLRKLHETRAKSGLTLRLRRDQAKLTATATATATATQRQSQSPTPTHTHTQTERLRRSLAAAIAKMFVFGHVNDKTSRERSEEREA